jgi:hypothetical protein
MLVFYINLIKLENIWFLEVRELHSFIDGRSTPFIKKKERKKLSLPDESDNLRACLMSRRPKTNYGLAKTD